MVENSGIEWTDHTFNPWEGCQKVAPECDNCYAEARDARFTGGAHWGPKAPRRRTSPQNWNKPLRWQKDAAAFAAQHGRRQRVFCASLADVFDNAVDPTWRQDLWNLIRACPDLDWLLLTKRPQNMAKMLPSDWCDGWPHVWLGTSAGTQKTADQNIPHLLATPAAVRFVSCEPLLGPVDLEPWLAWPEVGGEMPDGTPFGCYGCDGGTCQKCPKDRAYFETIMGHRDASGCPKWVFCDRITLDWAIVGGESGRNARPMNPDWARSLRDQCRAADVPFFFKQWGEWAPNPGPLGSTLGAKGVLSERWDASNGWPCLRVGKRAAGRLLDGRIWDEMPEARG